MTLQPLTDTQRVRIFQTLSDEKRIEIIRFLKNIERPPICGEVGQSLGISKSNSSYHLKLLSESGLVNIRKEGVHKHISLNLDTFEAYLPGFLATL
ncbi:ArsR family transcriptional regulator [Paenibacillus sp. FSL R7-277]|uniref:ArsR/SmtB family transcription factor n=1 Tax=unclassified Paenibacillus TaxID=185978 RepID=UPI0003E27484|nr:helix-turn-helix transcriptional regulator [Paenibacillus sp. FSL R7-277]ETT63615.1 ArsR family transcriptional regulator [Paenibacillus sp. FSL R7-277]OMG02316.1 transcriptional regulator [Paenibacillus sp. FSL R7-0333]